MGGISIKSLIVFYSLDGHTQLIADIIAEETGSDRFELKPVKVSGKSGFAKYFLGGMHATFNHKPALQHTPTNLKDYDLIYIGTPVWASRNAPAVNTFLSASDLTGKKIMLFASSGGGEAGKCFAKLRSQLTGCNTLGEICFKEPTSDSRDTLRAKIKSWLSSSGV